MKPMIAEAMKEALGCADLDAETSFLPAVLERVRRCPARPEYVELCFATSGGSFTWCFPARPRRRRQPAAALALTVGPYGVQARPVRDGRLEPALPGSSALPMIIAGADVSVARRLVSAGH
jgi:hypothetical protein